VSAVLAAAPLDGPFGVEVKGLDRRAMLSPAQRQRLADLFHEHWILLFRGELLSPRDYVGFVRQLGEPDPSPPLHAPIDIDGYTGLRFVSNIVEGGRPVGQFGNAEMGWHQDRWTDAVLPPATVLYGAEIPPAGGATSIASLAIAYDRLPADLKAEVERRTIHFPLRVRDPGDTLADADIDDPTLFCAKPMVQTHAVTGRKFLFLGARRIQDDLETAPRISGLSREDGERFMDAVFAALNAPGVAYRHDWRAGDLLMWDNRCCAHRREAFDVSARRLLYASPLVRSEVFWAQTEPTA
jgi:taurine dioxygenase